MLCDMSMAVAVTRIVKLVAARSSQPRTKLSCQSRPTNDHFISLPRKPLVGQFIRLATTLLQKILKHTKYMRKPKTDS